MPLIKIPTVQTISVRDARPFIEQHHYSGNLPAGKNECFALWNDNQIYAIAVYGLGVNMTKPENFLGRLSGLGNRITAHNLYELKRLARLGEKGEAKIQLTWFLAQCHQILRAKGIRFIFSFSDPEHDHTGGIYKASNFFRLGQTTQETHYVGPNGEFVHRRIPYRYMQKHNIILAKEIYGEVFVQECEKERLQLNFLRHLGREWPKVTPEIKSRQALLLLGDKAISSYMSAAKIMGLIPRKTMRKTRWFLPLFRNDYRIVAKYIAAQPQEALKVPPSETQFEPAVPLQNSGEECNQTE